MVRTLMMLGLLQATLWAQNQLKQQIEVIQGLMPGATSCVVLWNPKSSPELEGQFGTASSETGLRIIQSAVTSPRELSGVLKALSPYNPDFILMVSDKVVTGRNAIKFVVKAYRRDGVPIFGEGDEAIEGGAYGAMVFAGGKWKIRINGDVRSSYQIRLPEDDDRYLVSN
ncbi:MAG: hypothetical protein KDC35_10640 [Acidobacteria bacterium]|nr:hypothetical protein [Acidobacteriota bacterium]